ncbi:thioredoxin domain-containing protein [Microbacterium aureliae]
MHIEILHIEECPNWREAERRVRDAVGDLGIDADIAVRLITTPDEAVAAGFAGSPTILLDGADPFGGAPTADLACRVYVTETGLAGLPSVTGLSEALAAHR